MLTFYAVAFMVMVAAAAATAAYAVHQKKVLRPTWRK
jgi:hypothetical protein